MGTISLGTVVVSLILIAIVGGIIYSMVRKKRAGKNILCSGCESSSTCNGSCGLTEAMLDDMRQALDERDAAKAKGGEVKEV